MNQLKQLIKKDDVLEIISKYMDRNIYESKEYPSKLLSMKSDLLDEIKRIEGVYATGMLSTPPVNGKWLSYTGTHWTGREDEYGDPEYKEHIFYVCSNCRRKTVIRENFCPKCGSKMRDDKEI